MKEQQAGMEGETILPDLDNMNMALMAKEERICRLEKDLRDARSAIQQVQSRCRAAEKEKERGDLDRANLQADLEDAQSSIRNLERECKVKLDVVEKQRRALESLADKVEKQKELFQNELEDARRKLIESEEREQKYELASQHMAEKDRQLKSLRDAHEKLLAVRKAKQAEERHEIREVILELESSHLKCEEQNALIKEQEQELGKLRKEAHQLNARVTVAEANASSKESILEKVQLELKNASSHEISLAEANAQIEGFKVQVTTLMNKLSDESALRCKAERALHEYKVREDNLLKIEQDSKALQEEIKWRNEQFNSLEEAHNKMRDQLHEGLSMWTLEKATILKDIEILTENVQSKDVVNHNLRSQVKLLEQSIAREENCRKLLEFQLVDAKAGWESASAEFAAAQSILESLRENSKKELAFLKDTLAEKDRQLKELHVKQSQIDRDQKEKMELEAELDRYKSSCEQLEPALEKCAEQGLLAIEIRLKSKWQEEREQLMRSLTDAEGAISAKEVEMKELEMELGRTRILSEHLRTSLAEAEENRLEAKSEATSTLEQVSASLYAKEQLAVELETKLERLQLVVNDVKECNAKAERRIAALEDKLRDAKGELQANNKLSNSLVNVQVFDEVVLAMQSECQALQRQMSSCDLEKFEIEKHRDKLLTEINEKNHLHYSRKENLVDGRRDLSAMSAGRRTIAKQQVEDLTKQVKTLNVELQKWKDVAEKSDESTTKLQSSLESVQKEIEALKTELNEWMQKSLELDCVVKSLEADLEKWKQSAESRNDKNQLRIEEIEHLRAEVERWKNVAATAEDEGETARIEHQGNFGDKLNVMSNNERCIITERRSLNEVELDCSWQTSGRISNDWRHVASELEIEDWKKKAACVEKEQEDLKLIHQTVVKELRLEVEAWKKSAESIAEDGRLERVELQKKLKDVEAKAGEATSLVADEQKRSSLELAELQAELQIWKKRAFDAAEECTSLRDTYDNVIKEFRLELAQWKEKSETASEEGQSMRADLENVVQDLQNQVHIWKQKAKNALEDVVKNQEYEKSITALKEDLEAELLDWKSRAQEGVCVQLRLEKALTEMEEKAAAAATDTQALKEELAHTIAESSSEIDKLCSANALLNSKLLELKEKAEDSHSAQLLQLQNGLTETQSQLLEWHEKATIASQVENELRNAVEEIRSEKEELHNFIITLKDELCEWKEKAVHLEMSQIQLTSSLTSASEELKSWKHKALNAEMETDLDLRKSVSNLETELSLWKEKAQEGEFLHQQMKKSLTATQIEIQDLKEKIAAFSSSTDCLMDDLNRTNELASMLKTQLNTQKQNEASLLNLNRQLESDLVFVRKEAFSRKQKMTQILIQLEGTSNSQKDLQNKLHLAQRRLLENKKHHNQAESVNLRMDEKAAAKDIDEVVSCKSSPDTKVPLKSNHQRENEELRLEVNRVQRPNLLLQMQVVESSKAM